MPREPVVFGYEVDLQCVEGLADDERGFEHAPKVGSNAGVEIEVQEVRAIDIVAAGVPGVQIDAPEVDEPQQRGKVLHHRERDDAARRVFD